MFCYHCCNLPSYHCKDRVSVSFTPSSSWGAVIQGFFCNPHMGLENVGSRKTMNLGVDLERRGMNLADAMFYV